MERSGTGSESEVRELVTEWNRTDKMNRHDPRPTVHLVGSSFLCLRSRLHSFLSGSWFVPHLTIPHYSLHSWPKAGAAPYSRVPRNERSKRQGIGWKKRPQGETNDERSEWKTDTRFVCSSLVLGSPRSFVPRCPSVVYDPGPERRAETEGRSDKGPDRVTGQTGGFVVHSVATLVIHCLTLRLTRPSFTLFASRLSTGSAASCLTHSVPLPLAAQPNPRVPFGPRSGPPGGACGA